MHRLAALTLLFALGCGSTVTPSDDAALADTGSPDAFVADAGSLEDAASIEDAASLEDAFAIDATTDAATACEQVVTDIEAAAANVWFLSESDRALEVHVFAGEGAAAPTEATVVRLAESPGAATHETRATDRFAAHFEPAPSASDDAPSILEAAIAAGLTDTIFVAIIEDPTRSAEVRVILAGRTSCGDLVFVESISIET